jgi:hypothetical protein
MLRQGDEGTPLDEIFRKAGSNFEPSNTRETAPDSEGAIRKARFTGEHMVAIIREGSKAGMGSGQAARDQRADDLRAAQAFRRLWGERRRAAEAT